MIHYYIMPKLYTDYSSNIKRREEIQYCCYCSVYKYQARCPYNNQILETFFHADIQLHQHEWKLRNEKLCGNNNCSTINNFSKTSEMLERPEFEHKLNCSENVNRSRKYKQRTKF